MINPIPTSSGSWVSVQLQNWINQGRSICRDCLRNRLVSHGFCYRKYFASSHGKPPMRQLTSANIFGFQSVPTIFNRISNRFKHWAPISGGCVNGELLLPTQVSPTNLWLFLSDSFRASPFWCFCLRLAMSALFMISAKIDARSRSANPSETC